MSSATGRRAGQAALRAREIDVSIGRRLRMLREEHRYSIRRLARLAGVSPSLISEVERGLIEPSISVLKRLATALDTTLIYFFSPSEE